MSKIDNTDIEIALFERLKALTPAWTTQEPGEAFEPVPDNPWQRGTVLADAPEIVGFGRGAFSRLDGLYQIDLMYPIRPKGWWTLKRRADATRDWFHPVARQGLMLTRNDVRVVIRELPAVRQAPETAEGAFLRIIVEVPFTADDEPT